LSLTIFPVLARTGYGYQRFMELYRDVLTTVLRRRDV